jgi:hypothetical protein
MKTRDRIRKISEQITERWVREFEDDPEDWKPIENGVYGTGKFSVGGVTNHAEGRFSHFGIHQEDVDNT